VCATTGDHIKSTPMDIAEVDPDILSKLFEERNSKPKKELSPTKDPKFSSSKSDDWFGDLPVDIRYTSNSSTEPSIDPNGWRDSKSGLSAVHFLNSDSFYDRKEDEWFSRLGLFAVQQGILHRPWDKIGRAEYKQIIFCAKALGVKIPERDQAKPTFVGDIAELFEDTDRRRYAQKRDANIITTNDIRRRVKDAVVDAMGKEKRVVIEAPTNAGKSYSIASTNWRDLPDITGNQPVVHFHQSTRARDAAVKISEDAGLKVEVRESRHICPIANGEHEDFYVDGRTAKDFIDYMCDSKKMPFFLVHQWVQYQWENQHDGDLPCCEGGLLCPYAAQNIYGIRKGNFPRYDITHVCSPWAHVPGLTDGVNVIFDEAVDFEIQISDERVRKAINAFLKLTEVGPNSFDELIELRKYNCLPGSENRTFDMAKDEAAKPIPQNIYDEVQEAISHTPQLSWYRKNIHAHRYSKAFTCAVFDAVIKPAFTGRRKGVSTHEALLFPHNSDKSPDPIYTPIGGDENIVLVLNDSFEVTRVRAIPNLKQARSVIGLDATPHADRWSANLGTSLREIKLLTPEEENLWRRYDRNLKLVKVGHGIRPASGSKAREWFDNDGELELIKQLVPLGLRTGIWPKKVESLGLQILSHTGAVDPKTMHPGGQLSRNDFGDESVGYVSSVVDPGDDWILDWCAELELNAAPVFKKCSCDGKGCERCAGNGYHREHGRTFEGPDAAAAISLLESVREANTKQSIGRYARGDRNGKSCVVFVRTDAIGMEYDYEIPGVVWNLTEIQRKIQRHINTNSRSSILEIAEGVGVVKSTVHRCVQKLIQYGYVKQIGTGKHGAKLYDSDADEGINVVVDWNKTDDRDNIGANHVLNLYTYVASICPPGGLNPTKTVIGEMITDGSGMSNDKINIETTGDPPDE